MPTLLSDPSVTLYVLLAVAAAGCGYAWFRLRTRRALTVFAGAAGLLVAVGGTDALVESGREEAVRKVRLMETAVNARDWPAAFTHVSDQFAFRGQSKPAFRDRVIAAVTGANARVHFTAFDRDQAEYRPGGAVKIGFAGQAESPVFAHAGAVYIEAVFTPDPDGVLRLRALEVFEYIDRTQTQAVPGL